MAATAAPVEVQPAVAVKNTVDSCDPVNNWYVEGLSGIYDPQTTSFCQADGQWVIQSNGKNYKTCVMYGEIGAACTDSNVICPENPDGTTGVVGQRGNIKAALEIAMKRKDFEHEFCPTRTCETLEQYWRQMLIDQPFETVSEEQAYNVCAMSDNELYVVTADNFYPTCIGFSKNAFELCDSKQYLCAGHDGEGRFTYGWPGQIARTLQKAVVSTATNYLHPQCPVLMCSA